MSLISVKNFTAPVTNVVNLVAILGTVALFGLWRMMGGGFPVEEVGVRGKATPNKAAVETAAPQRRAKAANKAAPLGINGDLERQLLAENDRLLELMGEPTEAEIALQRRAKAKQPAQPPANTGTDNNSLADIERSLGLR